MSKLTGDKNLNFLILNELSDYELGKVCQVNKYAKELCDDETFWMNRIEKIFKLDSEVKLEAKEFFEFDTWKELYIYLSKEFDDYDNKSSYDDFKYDLEKYISYKPDIDKLLDLITYPIWVNKQLYKREEKRKKFWLVNPIWTADKRNFMEEFSNYLFDVSDFEYLNKNAKEFIKSFSFEK